jgi:hypothetical protein
VHNNNRSNDRQIGQVVAIDGGEKTQDFFLWALVLTWLTPNVY